MATTLPPPDALDGALPALDDAGTGTPQRSGVVGRLIWLTVLLGLVLGGGYWAWAAWSSREGADAGVSLLTHQVKRGKFLVTITEDGNLESANNRDLKCEVAGGSTILWIIKDGTQVTEGEELVRLDSSAIEEQITQQTIVVEKAQAARVQAEREFAAAEIAVREYEEGTFIQELNTLDANVIVAMENLRSAENSLQYAQRMSRKGYVNRLQLEAQEFAVERAKLDLAAAETAKRVLQDFTRAKMLEQLNSTRDSAEARMRSEQASYDLESTRLQKLQEQLAHCVITAPQDGMVVFANEPGSMRGGGQQGVQIEEGSQVRERQSIIRLPDLGQMQVKVTVHESKIERLAPGMPARIRIQGREFSGTVVSVANQPEATNWFMGNIKEYATIVKIEGASVDLKPGMTAEVEILVASLDDVLTVPLQSVVESRGRHFCFVQLPGGKPQQTEVELGTASSAAVEIKQGLQEGDIVLLNPPAIEQPGGADSEDDAEGAESDRFGGREPPPPAERPAGAAGGVAGGQPSPGGFDPMQFDKDGDKRISRDEAPEQMAAFFDRIDGNADGFLDQKEIAALRARMRQMQQAGGMPGAPPEGTGGG